MRTAKACSRGHKGSGEGASRKTRGACVENGAFIHFKCKDQDDERHAFRVELCPPWSKIVQQYQKHQHTQDEQLQQQQQQQQQKQHRQQDLLDFRTIGKMIRRNPNLCKTKYLFRRQILPTSQHNYSGDDEGRSRRKNSEDLMALFPLSQLLRYGPPLSLVQLIVEAFPPALRDSDDGESSQLPLHYACKYGNTHDVVTYIANLYPDAVKVPNNRCHLPVHYAVRYCTHDVVRHLVEMYPQCLFYRDSDDKTTLLHYACQFSRTHGEARKIILYLISRGPGACRWQSVIGLPIHHLFYGRQQQSTVVTLEHITRSTARVTDYNIEASVIDALLEAYPESVEKVDRHGLLPLHLACMGGCTATAAETRNIIERILEKYPRGASTPVNTLSSGACGMFPLQLIVSRHAGEAAAEIEGLIPLVRYSPQILKKETDKGRTVLDFARDELHREKDQLSRISELKVAKGRYNDDNDDTGYGIRREHNVFGIFPDDESEIHQRIAQKEKIVSFLTDVDEKMGQLIPMSCDDRLRYLNAMADKYRPAPEPQTKPQNQQPTARSLHEQSHQLAPLPSPLQIVSSSESTNTDSKLDDAVTNNSIPCCTEGPQELRIEDVDLTGAYKSPARSNPIDNRAASRGSYSADNGTRSASKDDSVVAVVKDNPKSKLIAQEKTIPFRERRRLQLELLAEGQEENGYSHDDHLETNYPGAYRQEGHSPPSVPSAGLVDSNRTARTVISQPQASSNVTNRSVNRQVFSATPIAAEVVMPAVTAEAIVRDTDTIKMMRAEIEAGGRVIEMMKAEIDALRSRNSRHGTNLPLSTSISKAANNASPSYSSSRTTSTRSAKKSVELGKVPDTSCCVIQ